MEEKVQKLLNRLDEVEKLLGDPSVFSDQKTFKELSQEHTYLNELKEAWGYFQKIQNELIQNESLLLSEKDPEMIEIIKEEINHLKSQIEITHKQIETILVPPDPRDNRNIIMELRAGTGGEEAALFVGDCVRMYKLFADSQGWKYEILGSTISEKGGYKEYVMSLSGKNVFRFMQYEAGTHRVQRVPETETQGRVHTSAITVAIMLEPSDDEKVVLDEKDLRIDTYRASGAGGQHVNTTDSAVRITHLPTNIVACCQDERSQHKNKEKAMRLLVAKIAEEKREKEAKERSETRSMQIGSGDRSERIRTYNFPQNRVTDHRIDLTLYKLDSVMEGDLMEIASALVNYYYQEKLSS
ncbi:MAG TPA: peptide chain release factor 1 [Chlamydiales bacterium]|nr:peptide chain release factor 1 [Chlamydiales bacterium]